MKTTVSVKPMPGRYMAICLLMGALMGAAAQESIISGRINDAVTGLPVQDATVYINGTALGTTSGQEGRFALKVAFFPCELIISHVSYELKRLVLQDGAGKQDLRISLDERVVPIGEVTVVHDQLREEYLRRFRYWFLGQNYQLYGADILNDSVLIFDIAENDQFSVHAAAPILVHLPWTGYLLNVDLVKFDLMYHEKLEGLYCSILGYFLFYPQDPGNMRSQRSIARNRAEQYYNSSMHLCRSLYHNSLAENGYVMERLCTEEEAAVSDIYHLPDFRASYVTDAQGNRHLLLTGFPCRLFAIRFYYNTRNRPVDLTYLDSNPARIERSGLQFLKDTVRIYPSGRIPENSILFSHSIGRKGVASMLPEDYIPSMQ